MSATHRAIIASLREDLKKGSVIARERVERCAAIASNSLERLREVERELSSTRAIAERARAHNARLRADLDDAEAIIRRLPLDHVVSAVAPSEEAVRRPSRFWYLVHNAVAHPLLATGCAWADRFHDWTATKMQQEER